MNEFCKSCNQSLREDDHLGCLRLDEGTVWACRECTAHFLGLPIPVPPIYPVGTHVPKIGDGMGQRDIRICACCRVALRWSEGQTLMRLLAEDVELEVNPPPVGALLACPACVERWRPVILERLKDRGYVPRTMEVIEMSGEMLV